MSVPEGPDPGYEAHAIPCLRVALSIPIRGTFDYALPQGLVSAAQVGCRALVPFNRRKVIGYVLETFSQSPDRELKETIDILDTEPDALHEAHARAVQQSSHNGCSRVKSLVFC